MPQNLCSRPVNTLANVLQYYHSETIDRSGSMACTDTRPLPNTPSSARIAARSNNRFGAVLSSLFEFWSARAAVTASSANGTRRDAYSVVLFQSNARAVIEHDFARSPDQLLDELLPHRGSGGTNFATAITLAQTVMERNWSTER